MSRLGITLFGVSGFSMLVLVLARTVLGGWMNWLFVPLGLFVFCALANLIVEFRFYRDFFTMRTTKHGMNMVTLIGLTLVLLFAVNFLAVRSNKKIDFTAEGLNSVSPQASQVLKEIDEPFVIRLFYRKGFDGVDEAKSLFKEVVDQFRDENRNVSIEYVSMIKHPGLTKEYGLQQSTVTAFVDYKGKRNRLETLDEQGLVAAMIKVSREENKKAFVLTGHGELSPSDEGPDGAVFFKKALQDSGYDVDEFNLTEMGRVPREADVVLILGPRANLLKSEVQALLEYARAGGKLFIAADPGQGHNLALLTKPFGIEFRNNYVLDQFGQIIGASAAMALGREYGPSEISKDFDPRMMTLFHLASSLRKADDADEKLTIENIVLTGDTSFTSDKIAQGKVEVHPSRRGPHTVAMESRGPVEGKEGEEFKVVVIGDSDFLSNQLIDQHLNRNLAVNSVSYLLDDSDLISILPRRAKGTTLTMTRPIYMAYLFVFILPLPLLMFGLGGFYWYRRRNA